jgi:hypothetical protein
LTASGTAPGLASGLASRAEPAGRAVAHERRSDLRDPPGLGGAQPGYAGRGVLVVPVLDVFGIVIAVDFHEPRLDRFRHRARLGVESDVSEMLELAGLHTSGQSDLFDGRTGDQFDRKVPPNCALPPSGCWVTSEYGPIERAWILSSTRWCSFSKMLTVKSDDVVGRTKVYEAIVKGDDTFEAGIPESSSHRSAGHRTAPYHPAAAG